MPRCKMCGRKSIFLSVNEYGLCDKCYSYICEDYRNRERILIESRKIIETSKNPETQLRCINVMKEHFQVLLRYEKMGIPITDPPPSVLLKRLDIEREQILAKNETREIDDEPFGRRYKRLSKELSKRLEDINKHKQMQRFFSNPQRYPNPLLGVQAKRHEMETILDIMVEKNNNGIIFEKNGNIDEAIKLYEQNVTDEFFGRHPYDRLTIIYRRRKQYNDEIRIIEKAIEIIGDTKYKKRLEKAKTLKENIRRE